VSSKKQQSLVKQKIQTLILKAEGILLQDNPTTEMRELADSCRELAKELRLSSAYFSKRTSYEPEDGEDLF
jgi:hypothetical protein